MSQLWNFLLSLPPVVAAIFSALLGAFAAQMLSHWLTNRREKDKYNREVYQKLYAPMIFDAFYYVDLKTRFDKYERPIQTGEEETIQKRFFDHIGNNLMYANPKIISAYHDLSSHNYTNYDPTDYMTNIYILNLFLSFLDSIISINNVSKINIILRNYKLFDKAITEKLHSYRTMYITWIILYKMLLDMDKATRILQYAKGCNANYQKMLEINGRFNDKYQLGHDKADRVLFMKTLKDIDRLLAHRYNTGNVLSHYASYIYDHDYEELR